MMHYEMLCVLPGTMTEEEVAETMKTVTETVTTHGATISSTFDKGKSRLAYPIKHIRYGYFQLVYFAVEPEQLAEIERRVRLIGTLLRTLVRTYDPARQSELAAFSLSPQPAVRDAQPAEAAKSKPVQTEEKPKTEAPKAEEKAADVSLDEIDNKLDEILEKDLSKV